MSLNSLVRCGVGTSRSTPRRTRMETRSTRIEVPNGVEAYVFGSVLNEPANANDVDVLFVYDAAKIHPARIYDVLAPLWFALTKLTGHRIHPVVLSQSEAASD